MLAQQLARPYVREARRVGGERIPDRGRSVVPPLWVFVRVREIRAGGGEGVSRRDPGVPLTRSSEDAFVSLLSKNGAEGRN